MKYLKLLVITMVTVALSLVGCGKKDNSNESNPPLPEVSDSQNPQESGQPGQVAETLSPSESEDSLEEGYSGVVVVDNHTISETSRVGSGIAMMVGGSLVMASGYGTARLSDKLVKIISVLVI